MIVRRCRGLLIFASLTFACGEAVPVAPVTPAVQATPVPTPAPTAAPTPTPTPTPDTCDDCEPPTVNTAPPARLTLRLYAVEDGLGRFLRNPSVEDFIPVGWFARMDVVAKDENNDETNGSDDIEWHFSDCCLARVSGNHTHQRRLKVLEPGFLDVWVTQQGVQSNTVTLRFGN